LIKSNEDLKAKINLILA